MKRLTILAIVLVAIALIPSRHVEAAPQLYASTSCTTASTFEATFYWTDVRRDTRQVELQLSYYDNGWRPNTYQASGWRSPDTTRLSWSSLPTGRTYFFALQAALADGTFELGPTYYVEAPICATPGQPAVITSPDSGPPIVNCGLQTCLVDEVTGLITVPSDIYCSYRLCPPPSSGGSYINGQFIPYAGNGLGPTLCADGLYSHSAGSGTCSSHGGIAR